MRDETRLSLDDTLRQLFIFEPHGGGRERRIIPRLTIGERLIVIPDHRRRFFHDLIHAACRRIVELVTGAQQRGRRDVVAGPERLQVRGEEQAAGTEHVIAVGIAPVALCVAIQDVARPRRGGAIGLVA